MAVRRPSSIDPALLRDGAGVLVARQVVEPLVRLDPQTLVPAPALAASWEVHDGGSRFVFRLRPGAAFHGGKEVTAGDARFALDRLARKESGSGLAFLVDQVAGFGPANAGEAEGMEGLATPDGGTLEVRLAAPWVEFPALLAHPATGPVPRETAEADPGAFRVQPAGAGPYQLAGPLQEGEDLLLRRFGGYAGPRPQVESVRFLFYDDPGAAWRDFEAGLADVAEVPAGELAPARTRGEETGFSAVAAGVYLGLNVTSPTLADRRLRQAISLAIDRATIARAVFGDAAVPADGIVPADVPGRNDLACGALCRREPERARALVREALGEVSPEVAYDYPQGEAAEALAQTVRANLEEAGIRVALRPAAPAAFLGQVRAGRHEMFPVTWVAEYPLADWFLSPLFRSGAPENSTGFSSAEVDDLLARARAEADPSERVRLYREAEARLLREMAVVPVAFFRNRWVAGERVRGFHADLRGGFDVARLSLAGR